MTNTIVGSQDRSTQMELKAGELFDIRDAVNERTIEHVWFALSESTRRNYAESMLRCAVWIENPVDERLQRNARKRPEPKKRHDETTEQRDERIKCEYLQAASVLPIIDDGTLADYVKSMDQAGLTPAAVAMGVAAVKWGWKNLLRAGTIDWGTRGLDWTLTAAAMKRVRRDSEAQCRGQVKGLTWEEVDEIVKRTVSSNSIHGLRDAALILLMSDCLLRVSEAVAVNVEDFEENGLTVQRSKTDQTGETATLYIGDQTKHLINRYLMNAGITAGAVFVRLKTTKSGPQPTDQRLTDRAARDIIKQRAKGAGIDGLISGHSLRVGTAVSLAQAGAGISEMQDVGRWESQNMPGHYARVKEAEKDAVARYRYGKGL